MVTNNKDYDALIALRAALVGKPQAQKRVEEEKAKLNRMQLTLPKFHACTEEQDRLITEFSAPYIDPWKKRIKEKRESMQKSRQARTKRFRARRKFFFSLLVLALLTLGGFLTCFLAAWSFDAGVPAIMNSILNVDRVHAIGIYLLALCLLFTAGTLTVAFFLFSHRKEILAWIVGIAGCIGGGYLLIQSFIYYYSTSSGFWEILLTLLGSIFSIIRLLVAIFFVVPFVLVGTGTLILCILLWEYAKSSTWHAGDRYLAKLLKSDEAYLQSRDPRPQIDLAPLQKEARYQEAVKKDQATSAARQEAYNKECEAARQKFTALQTSQRALVDKYVAILQNCDQTIRTSNILHDNQKNVKMIDTILYYFEMRRATTVREAMNEYQHDMDMQRLYANQQATARAMQDGMKELTAKLDKIKTTVAAEMTAANQMQVDAIQKQTAALNAQLSKMQEDERRHSANMESAANSIKGELGSIYTQIRIS